MCSDSKRRAGDAPLLVCRAAVLRYTFDGFFVDLFLQNNNDNNNLPGRSSYVSHSDAERASSEPCSTRTLYFTYTFLKYLSSVVNHTEHGRDETTGDDDGMGGRRNNEFNMGSGPANKSLLLYTRLRVLRHVPGSRAGTGNRTRCSTRLRLLPCDGEYSTADNAL